MADRAHRADLRRSLRLLREFRQEQPDPDRFYTALAADSVAQLGAYATLAGATMLDVGGGPGYFRTAFEAAGAAGHRPRAPLDARSPRPTEISQAPGSPR